MLVSTRLSVVLLVRHRVVPGLALDCRNAGNLGELLGRRGDQSQLTNLGQHDEQILLGEE